MPSSQEPPQEPPQELAQKPAQEPAQAPARKRPGTKAPRGTLKGKDYYGKCTVVLRLFDPETGALIKEQKITNLKMLVEDKEKSTPEKPVGKLILVNNWNYNEVYEGINQHLAEFLEEAPDSDYVYMVDGPHNGEKPPCSWSAMNERTGRIARVYAVY